MQNATDRFAAIREKSFTVRSESAKVTRGRTVHQLFASPRQLDEGAPPSLSCLRAFFSSY